MDNDNFTSKGLTSKKAEKLLGEYGLNEIKEKRNYIILLSILNQFGNFLIIVLIIAGIISFLLGEKIDSFFIFFVVLLNASFGVYQEFKAEKALQKLKQLTISKTRVIRDGKEQEIDSKYLVPEDIVYLEEGAKIPADCQIIKSWHLEVNESALTGESLSVLKNENNQEQNSLFMGTVVAKGRTFAQVLKTGQKTNFGKIVQTLSQIKEQKTPLQNKLELFSKQIGIIGLAASIMVFIFSFIQDKTLFQSFLFAVSLAVAVIPEGLPAAVTITLAIGVERMSKKKAIIRKLNSIETLGAVTLVATDKTGTLTTNQMNVKKIWLDQKEYDYNSLPPVTSNSFKKILLNSILCSTASIVLKVNHGNFDVVGDTTEGALLLFAQKMKMPPEKIRDEWKNIDELTFNPVTKRMSVAVCLKQNSHEVYIFSKGAPESILSISSKVLIKDQELDLNEEKKIMIEQEFQNFAKSGLRIIAFSYKKGHQQNLESNQVFLGFAGIADPVRDEVKNAVSKAKKAGIKIVMITGDNQLTAEAIGIETGIIEKGEDILTGSQIDNYSEKELVNIIPKIKIFARTSPEHKFKLVKLFQKQKEIVAVTGDGVNDALALKQADVGVAMGITGTDVAKETADMIIADDNFATLINAVEEGRNIFNHIKNAVKYLLTSNIAEIFSILITVILKLPLLLTASQILYINLVTDGIPALSIAFSPKEGNIMKKDPRKELTILDKSDFKYIFMIGFFGGILTTLSFLIGLAIDGVFFARTMAFTTLMLIQPLVLIDLWLSHRIIIKHFKLMKHPIFLISILLPFFLQPFLISHPFFQKILKLESLHPQYIFLSFILSLFILLPIEIKKIFKKTP